MTVAGWAQIVIFLVVLTALTPLLGGYMARVYQGRHVLLSPLGGASAAGSGAWTGWRVDAGPTSPRSTAPGSG
jgi:hypothetical protein